ncbi:family 43 glycosylhydrolase [Microbacterium sp. SLBN-111]|uniref:family 43 glycosylhydrolase n=1 Tax=Microbacterium sp. SLBN-111 TaxID=3377733 RepID=UPI003C7490BB
MSAEQRGRRFFADPSLSHFDGRFFLYPTTDGSPEWAASSFRVLSSTDLAQWDDDGVILRLGEDVAWADRFAWAPSAAERDGRFFFYFTADDNIGVASAPTPRGPFVDSGRPLVARGAYPGRAIDPSVFVDDDGTAYLVWGNTVAHVARLSDDMLAIDPETVSSWEHPTFREAAHLHRRGDRYFLTWSENDTRDPSYRVRWADGPGPHGPWQDRGVLLETATGCRHLRDRPPLDSAPPRHRRVGHRLSPLRRARRRRLPARDRHRPAALLGGRRSRSGGTRLARHPLDLVPRTRNPRHLRRKRKQ